MESAAGLFISCGNVEIFFPVKNLRMENRPPAPWLIHPRILLYGERAANIRRREAGESQRLRISISAAAAKT